MDVKETEWYQTRPSLIQQRIDEYPPLYLYRRKSTGHVERAAYDFRDAMEKIQNMGKE